MAKKISFNLKKNKFEDYYLEFSIKNKVLGKIVRNGRSFDIIFSAQLLKDINNIRTSEQAENIVKSMFEV